jgi:quinol monooxygenase YgiN
MPIRNVVLIRHKVANYKKWKAVFDAHGPSRREQGCERVHVFRRADNPKELVIMLSWGDLGRAREYVVSTDLRGMLAETPMSDRAPDVYLLEEVEQAGQVVTSDEVAAPLRHESAEHPITHPDWAC